MKRKIVKQGNSALTITLPAFWAKKFKLKQGDEVEIREEEGFLKITPEATGENSIEIDLTGLNDALIWTYIISSYRKGYDTIKVKFQKERIKLIQQVVNALLGLAIVEQDENSCVIRALSTDSSEKEFKNMMRRIFYLIEEMAETTLNAVKQNNRENLKNIEFQDYNVNKFANFCLSLINKKSLGNSVDYIVTELENTGDEYARLALDLSAEKTFKVNKELIKIFEETNTLFSSFHNFFYDFTKEKAIEIVNKKNKLNNLIGSVAVKSKEEILIAYHLSKIIHLITNLGERVIMMNI